MQRFKSVFLKFPASFWAMALTLLLVPSECFAHAESGVAGGLVSGLLHPVMGFDHLLAMVAVGLWGAQLKQPAIWLLPINFPLVMALGALLGMSGVGLPFIELGIALSALVLGVMVAFSVRLPLFLAMAVVAVFAIFHGHAHGTEIPHAANPLAYGVGFVLATGLLHLLGILIGSLNRWQWGAHTVRGAGVVIAAMGSYFFMAALG